MTAAEAAQAACSLIARTRRGNPIVVAIDGGGGAGKSTLAAAIRNTLTGVSIVRVDDFYRPLHDDPRAANPEFAYLNHSDCDRIREQALIPLRAGRSARYQPIEWVSGQPIGWVEVERNPVIVLEGVYSMRPELRELVEISVFVDSPRDLRRKRMSDRIQSGTGWIDRWMAAEDWYLENIKPMESANLIVRGF